MHLKHYQVILDILSSLCIHLFSLSKPKRTSMLCVYIVLTIQTSETSVNYIIFMKMNEDVQGQYHAKLYANYRCLYTAKVGIMAHNDHDDPNPYISHVVTFIKILLHAIILTLVVYRHLVSINTNYQYTRLFWLQGPLVSPKY